MEKSKILQQLLLKTLVKYGQKTSITHAPYTKESLDNKFNEYIPLLQKVQANGVATLDANGKLTAAQLSTLKNMNGISVITIILQTLI